MSESAAMTARHGAALDDARQVLAECLLAEAEAERQFAAAEAAMWQRRDEAAALSDDDTAVEAFAAWMPQGRRQVAAAQVVLDRASAETARARAVLAHFRVADGPRPGPGG